MPRLTPSEIVGRIISLQYVEKFGQTYSNFIEENFKNFRNTQLLIENLVYDCFNNRNQLNIYSGCEKDRELSTPLY